MADASHADKMCAIACCPCNLDLEKIKSLAKDARFVCASCGRVAASEANLCKPVPME